MAKTTVKKSKRRLKRTVRRSFAAVLMITAIGVAAIPVPENFAADDDVTPPAESVIQYEQAVKADDYEANSSNTQNPYADIEQDEVTTDETIKDDIEAGNAQVTEVVINEGGSLYLTWQFIYKPLAADAGVLCKYNDQFSVPEVDLGLQPVEHYYTVTNDDYSYYFTDPTQMSSASKAQMDNLVTSHLLYPTRVIQYTWQNYDPDTKEMIGLENVEKEFLLSYYGDVLGGYNAEFQKYWDKKNNPTEYPDLGPAPDSLLASPQNLNSTDQSRFFHEHNKVLKGTTYQLTQVKDYRYGIANPGSWIYVASGGSQAELKGYEDDKGYIVTRDVHFIHAIGEKAFYRVENVGQITISGQVKHIGDSAFEKSGISSLHIGNAKMIGNRAFCECSKLKTVTFSGISGLHTIGAEAFRASGVEGKLVFPNSLEVVGHGAFSDCIDLTGAEFDINNTAQALKLRNYAFYNDKKLSDVNFGKIGIEEMGRGCFAIQSPSNDTMTEFTFPTVRLAELDEYVLANRRSLKVVTISNFQKELPETTFYNCFGLEQARFVEDSARVNFKPKLFYYVTNPDFCVYGPEFYDGENPAYPRISTWDAERKDGQGIPYVYEKNGKTHYEVALESEDGTRYRYGASSDGELISCALITANPGKVDIVIPSKIGKFDVRSIGGSCFSDADLRKVIKTITIQNKSVSEIANDAFKNLPELVKVRLGDSVTGIGANAFYGCNKLQDVYFTKPEAGYEAVTFGANAFVTTGGKLTFHGDIVKGYAPFDYAMSNANKLADPDDRNATPKNICYKSLWDSETGTHLTVMTDADGTVTLLDYPKFKDLDKDNIRFDEELQDYCRDMENYYYYTVYDSGDDIERLRSEYALIQYAYNRNSGSVDLNGDGVADLTFRVEQDYKDALNDRYGPWINPNYCGDVREAGYWTSYLPASGGDTTGGGDSSKADLMDLLFEPIVAQAAGGNPTPYFTAYPYNFMENYENFLTNPDYGDLPEYKSLTPKEWRIIAATKDIVVPDGVDSIDVKAYMDNSNNSGNCKAYLGADSISSESRRMYTSVTGGAKPGLFSGYYKDYETDSDSRETNPVGNDHITSIVLTSVKSLPDYAFDSCELLERVELGAVETMGELPFRGCPNVTQVIGSAKYPAENGIIYEKKEGTPEKYKIMECLMSRGLPGTGNESLEKTSIAPESDSKIGDVDEIASGAFEDCVGLGVIDLSSADGLSIIPEDCFNNCTALSNVKLPRSVTKIREDAFGDITTPLNVTPIHELHITIPGREVDIADTAFEPKNAVTIYTYEDSAAYRYGVRYKNQGMRVANLDAYRVMFYDYDGTQIGTVQLVEKDAGALATEPAETETLREENHRPGYTFDRWETTGGKTLTDKITEDMTIFIAQYTSDGSMVNGKYVVEFLDGINGQRIGDFNAEKDGRYYVTPGESFMDNGWQEPPYNQYPHEGYTFLEWSQSWTVNTKIDSNMTVIALFKPNPTSGGSTNTSGGSTNTSGGSSSTGNKNSSKNSTSSSASSSSSTSSSSTSTSSTTSGSASDKAVYTVTVVNGSGSGTYEQGSTVVISANEPAPGMVFQKWTTESNGVNLASVSMTATTFTMPAGNVTVTANYVAGTNNAASTNSTGGGNGGGSGSGSTRVDITKPGISNKDLATANANGTTDNFIVKITETDEATRAVADALANKYGSLDNILYYAMDISLWDSTGTYQLSGDQLSGISVDITIPIPDALVAYGGNNMAGAVVNGNQLENLRESFTAINGVPCIRFTASHFSPYTVYVDTGNLTEGMLDATPKTGDPIHPKWFLSLGLACLSIILFIKKDKSAKVKTA